MLWPTRTRSSGGFPVVNFAGAAALYSFGHRSMVERRNSRSLVDGLIHLLPHD